MRCSFASSLTIALLVTAPASAGFTFSEGATDANIFAPPDAGLLSEGVNTISGHVAISSDSFDGFLFTLPVGLTITDVSITLTGFGGLRLRLESGATAFDTGTLIDEFSIPAAPTIVTFSGTPLTDPVQYFIGNTGISGVGASIDYTYSISVAAAEPIPLPSTIVMASFGLLAFGRYGWRRIRRA